MNTRKNQQTRKLSAPLCILVLALSMMAGVALLWPMSGALAQQGEVRTDVVEALSFEREPLRADKVNGDEKTDPNDVAVPPSLAPDLITTTTYPFTSAAGVALEDMSTGTTQLVAAGSDDGNSAIANIGFDSWYDGVRFTQFGANANGFVRLGVVPAGASFNNATGFNSATNAPKIAPFYDDLCVGTTGRVHFKTIGSAPNRKLIVEWQNMQITRGAGCAGVGGGTFQMWLFESAHATTPGVIEFVYGPGMVATAPVDGGYSVGLQSGAAANFASVTTVGPTVSYVAANNTQTDAIASGTAYIFTPNVPLAPSGGSVGPITQTSLQLNWTDNATNEVGYVIYRSTDNVIFNFVTQIAAGSTSFNDTGLSPGTQYFYHINAVTEGVLSTDLALSGTTSPAGNDTCAGAGGDWDNVATWTDGSVPTAGDNVTIGTGCTVTVNVTNAVALSVTVDSGGTLQSPTTGVVINNNLTVSESVTNNGTLDFSTNGDTSAAILTFGAGSANVTFGGTGATTDIRAITVAKGAQARVVELNTTNFTVQGVNTDVAGYLTLTSGTFKISGTFTIANRTFTTPTYIIPATGGIWLNNPNYTVSATASAAATSNNGLFRVTTGTYNIGIGIADQMRGGVGAVFTIEGGTINVSGAFDPQSAITYNQSGGTMNVGVVGNNVSNFGTFEIFSTTSFFTMSGGTINLINPSTGATKVDFRVNSPLANQNITGGTVFIGATGAPPSSTYNVVALLPSVTINPTMTMAVNGAAVFMRGSTVLNNGAITGIGASPRFDFGSQNSAMTYGGSGVFGTNAVPFAGVGISANSLFLITLSSPIICNRVNLFQGGFINSNQITLGNAGTSTTVVQIGSTGLTTPGGNFDVSPNHNQGTGGQILLYAFETAPRTTGFEVNPTRILTSINLIDNINTVTIAGGDLTLTAPAAAIVLTNGRFITGANTLILSSGTATVTRTNGYVDGNFRKTYAAAVSKTFEVGTANAFSPATMNVTAGTFPATLTVAAVQGPQPVLNPATSLQRYWRVTEGGDVTATMTFTYLDPLDVAGIEANYRVIRVTTGTAVNFPEVCPAGPCVDEAANNFVIPGVSAFSDWTAGEPAVPTAAPATISGQVTTASGAPLAGVTMHLSGARSARAVTDASGTYRFINVDTDNFYTVTPSIINYRFSPASRSFSLLGNTTDATFTGTRDAVTTGNVIDTPEYFVRQHYLDFLGREPDQAGLEFWSGQILGCGNDFACMERRTINVSAAYFLSIEFQETGGLVDRVYQASYGRAPLFSEFMPDTATIARDLIVNEPGWQDRLLTNKREFLDAWVQRADFRAAYDNLANEGYVDTLIRNTDVTFTDVERAALVSGLVDGTLSRAQVLQRVAQNERFVREEFNEAFVRMQYFGYLRRDPDSRGFQFWLNKLDEFEGNFERAEMVKAFLVSGEYRERFRQ